MKYSISLNKCLGFLFKNSTFKRDTYSKEVLIENYSYVKQLRHLPYTICNNSFYALHTNYKIKTTNKSNKIFFAKMYEPIKIYYDS